MNWRFWDRKNRPLISEGELTLASINERIRGFLLDSQIQDAHEIARILGCSLISEEVAQREEEESEKRVEKVSYLIPLMYAQANLMAQGSVDYQRVNLPEEAPDIPEEVWFDSRKLLEQVSIAVLLGAISQLVDMGLLKIPRRL